MTTTPLYSRNGAMPEPLPTVAYDDQGFSYTPPYADADLARLGFKLGPAIPAYDAATEQPAWDAKAGKWVIIPIDTPVSPEVDYNAVINAERDRRIRGGITFQGVVYQSDDVSRDRIDKSRVSAITSIMSGAQPGNYRWTGLDLDFFWIALDDTRTLMDAQTMMAFGNAMAAREGVLIVAANDLKKRVADGEVIQNVGDDALWP